MTRDVAFVQAHSGGLSRTSGNGRQSDLVAITGADHGQRAAAGDPRAELEAVLARLPALDSAAACDELAVAFCYVGGKAARRRLVGAQVFYSFLFDQTSGQRVMAYQGGRGRGRTASLYSRTWLG